MKSFGMLIICNGSARVRLTAPEWGWISDIWKATLNVLAEIAVWHHCGPRNTIETTITASTNNLYIHHGEMHSVKVRFFPFWLLLGSCIVQRPHQSDQRIPADNARRVCGKMWHLHLYCIFRILCTSVLLHLYTRQNTNDFFYVQNATIIYINFPSGSSVLGCCSTIYVCTTFTHSYIRIHPLAHTYPSNVGTVAAIVAAAAANNVEKKTPT